MLEVWEQGDRKAGASEVPLMHSVAAISLVCMIFLLWVSVLSAPFFHEHTSQIRAHTNELFLT